MIYANPQYAEHSLSRFPPDSPEDGQSAIHPSMRPLSGHNAEALNELNSVLDLTTPRARPVEDHPTMFPDSPGSSSNKVDSSVDPVLESQPGSSVGTSSRGPIDDQYEALRIRDPSMSADWLRVRGTRVSRFIEDATAPNCPIAPDSLTWNELSAMALISREHNPLVEFKGVVSRLCADTSLGRLHWIEWTVDFPKLVPAA
ncbi:hypothetical protein N7456_004322 [Penicillium angulare]|uniref:Uncharacterized protein n=1 Tax=Penicillium angulare TaxID=116970 RepID=A0A9W9FY30_9EURO|nr:hypothetical protein N7456_004322 [Penicillium angulare]